METCLTWDMLSESVQPPGFFTHVYADSVSEFIKKCIGDVVPTVTIKTFLNQKPWIDGSNHAKLKARTIAFNHGKATENMTEYKQCSYSFRKAFKLAKHQYRDKVESQFKGSNTRRMWKGLHSITDYKKKTSLGAPCSQTN